MKKFYKYPTCLSLIAIVLFVSGCINEEDSVLPRIEAPVLVVIAGNSFEASEPVSLSASFYELDKSGLLDHTVGIDSIPISNLEINVYKFNTQMIETLLTDGEGKVVFTKTWEDLGLLPESGNSLRLEFVGNFKDVPFRRLHNISVK